MSFWVDTTSTDYPTQGFKDCVSQGNCQKYVQVNQTLFLSLDLYSVNASYIGASILDIMILEFDVTYGDVDPENFREAFNDVIVAAIPVINQQARAGIQNPLIGD